MGKFGIILPCFSHFLAQNTPKVPSFGVLVGPSDYKWYFTDKSQIFSKLGAFWQFFFEKFASHDISTQYLRITFLGHLAINWGLCWSDLAVIFTKASLHDYPTSTRAIFLNFHFCPYGGHFGFKMAAILNKSKIPFVVTVKSSELQKDRAII